jgi:Flp pilus assembly protein TadD
VNLADAFGVTARKTVSVVVEKIPLFLLAAVSCASTMVMQARGNNLYFGERVSFAARCANAVVVYVLYLVKTAWPSGLAVFYPHPITRPMWQVAGAALVLVLVTLFCLLQARRRPYLVVGWFWYLGTLVPVIELVQAGEFSHADRYTYIPSIGIFIMVVWGIADLASAWHMPRRVLAVATGLVLVILAVCAGIQTSYWRDSKTLFNHAIAAGYEGGLSYYNLGMVARDEKRYDDAKSYFVKAVKISPRHLKAINNLGALAMFQGHYDEAKTYLMKALELKPDDVRVLNNLGGCLMYEGQNEEAQLYFRKALEIDPKFTDAMTNLAAALAQSGHQEEADAYIKRATELNRASSAKKQ